MYSGLDGFNDEISRIRELHKEELAAKAEEVKQVKDSRDALEDTYAAFVQTDVQP